MICWWVYSLLLLAAGDVEFNPGPTENLNNSLGQVAKFKMHYNNVIRWTELK